MERAMTELSDPNARVWITFALAELVLMSSRDKSARGWPVSQVVHVLYDDFGRFPHPNLGEGAVYYINEIGPLLQLADQLDPLLDSVGSESWDGSLSGDPGWRQVEAAAARALAIIVRNSAEIP